MEPEARPIIYVQANVRPVGMEPEARPRINVQVRVQLVNTAMKPLEAPKANAKLVQPGIIALGELLESHVDPVNMAINLLKAQKEAARAARTDITVLARQALASYVDPASMAIKARRRVAKAASTVTIARA